MRKKIIIKDEDLHHHIRSRMVQRGITMQELETTINKGWNASDVKPGTAGRTFIFSYNAYWEEKYFEEKEVTVYYKDNDGIILLTAKARYGSEFIKGDKK